MFGNGASNIERIHWPQFDWWSEALHGLARGTSGVSTSWPQVIGIGSTFNKTLFRALGELTSTEARGRNAGLGKSYWAPNVK